MFQIVILPITYEDEGKVFPSPYGTICFKLITTKNITSYYPPFRPLTGQYVSNYDKYSDTYHQGLLYISVPLRGNMFQIKESFTLTDNYTLSFRPLTGQYVSNF